MRNVPEGVLDLWRRKGFKVDAKVSVYDGTSWVDLDTWQNKKWLYYISIEDDIDRDVIEATVRLASSEGNFSISPFVYEDTPLQVWRKIKIEACLLPTGTWTNIFEGYIDSIEVTQDEITVRCRDYGALLIDTFIEEERTYGTDNGTAVEGEMQKILDDNLGTGVVSLYTPTSPNWYVKKWKQEQKSVMDALTDLADQIGWYVRYRWDNSTSTWRLTFYSPQRNKTTPDLTLDSSNYFEIQSFKTDISSVRNKICVKYISSSTNNIATYTAKDDTSISQYGVRYMEIDLDKTSNIDTSTEAQTLAQNVLADLKDPKLEVELAVPFAPFLEIGDCILLSRNSILFSADQTLYIGGISHEITPEEATTTIKLFGKAVYGIRNWLVQEKRNTNGTITLGNTITSTAFSTTSTDFVDIPNTQFTAYNLPSQNVKAIFEIGIPGYEGGGPFGAIRLVRINSDNTITEVARVGIPLLKSVIFLTAFLELGAVYKFQAMAYEPATVYVLYIKRRDFISLP